MSKEGQTVVVGRAQKGPKGSQTKLGDGEVDRVKMDKEVVKAVLASPLTVAWPNLPRHLQYAVTQVLPLLLPTEVADYHVSRQRCQKRANRVARTAERAAKRGTNPSTHPTATTTHATGGCPMPEDVTLDPSPSTKSPGCTKKDQSQASVPQASTSGEGERGPARPEILQHLVLGINEMIKALEQQIHVLKMEMMMMADRLALSNGLKSAQVTLPTQRFLPTAPDAPVLPHTSPQLEDRTGDVLLHKPPAALAFVIVPLPDINPPALVDPIPQYCATYNSLVYQHNHLSRIFKSRIKAADWGLVADGTKEEVRVVPLARVEGEMAALAGLRRLACLGIRESHPALKKVADLLPKSVLHPPRHSVTLPFPIPSLKVYSGQTGDPMIEKFRGTRRKLDTMGPEEQPKSTSLPIPHVHYAPIHIKGITTTVPADGPARKARRLQEVRARRVENKEKKREDRARFASKLKYGKKTRPGISSGKKSKAGTR